MKYNNLNIDQRGLNTFKNAKIYQQQKENKTSNKPRSLEKLDKPQNQQHSRSKDTKGNNQDPEPGSLTFPDPSTPLQRYVNR
jgi:hypothetical protein